MSFLKGITMETKFSKDWKSFITGQEGNTQDFMDYLHTRLSDYDEDDKADLEKWLEYVRLNSERVIKDIGIMDQKSQLILGRISHSRSYCRQ